MRFSLHFNLLLFKNSCLSQIPLPSKGEDRVEGIGISINTLGVALVIVSVFFGFPVFAQSSDVPQELPKPKLKATPPLFQEWTFNNDQVDSGPSGFSGDTVGDGSPGIWKIEVDSSAPSRPQALVLKPGCQKESCYHVLLADDTIVEYLDLGIRIKMMLGVSSGKAGLVFSAKDNKNFYAVVVTPETNTLQAYLVQDGQARLLGEEKVLPMEGEWHFLRVHRISYISHFPIECYFDNQLILHLSDSTLGEGKVGLITMGQGAFAFDNLRAVELLTERPLSRPPAY